MRLFGAAPVKAVSATSGAAQLQNAMHILDTREEHLERKIAGELRAAQAKRGTNRAAALACLKRKKAYEAQLAQTVSQRFTLEQQLNALESTTVASETVAAMKVGTAAMSSAHAAVDPDDVHELMDTVTEQMNDVREMEDAMGRIFGESFDLDDDDLENELAALDLDELDEPLAEAEPALPEVPRMIPTKAQEPPAATAVQSLDLELAL